MSDESEIVVGVRVEGGGTYVWRFPGTVTELRGEVRDRHAPFDLIPGWSGKKSDILGKVKKVPEIPSDVAAVVTLEPPDRATVSAAGKKTSAESADADEPAAAKPKRKSAK